jgi:hypothetical protein
MTIMEHAFRDAEIHNLFNEVESPVLATLGYRIDYTDSIASPSEWATDEMLREIALASGFTLSEAHAFFADPNAFLGRSIPGADSYYWENPIVALSLDRAWGKYVQQQVHSHVRTAAIRGCRLIGGHSHLERSQPRSRGTMAMKKKVIFTHALEAECKKAGLNPRKVDDLTRELGRIGRKAQRMGLKVFGGSGNGMGAFRCGNPLERIVGFAEK